MPQTRKEPHDVEQGGLPLRIESGNAPRTRPGGKAQEMSCVHHQHVVHGATARVLNDSPATPLKIVHEVGHQ